MTELDASIPPAAAPAAASRAGGGPEPEGALLARLRAGDDAAFAEVLRLYGPRLLAVARRLLRDEEEARDALQEAFLSAFRSLDRFQGDSRLSTWLHQIVLNASLMKLRTRRRKPEEPIDTLLPRYYTDGHRVDPGPAWTDSIDHALTRRETRELVRLSIDRLPETYRVVLLLRDIEELDTAETARILDISENAVKVRLHRARQALRTLLDPHFRETAT